VIVGCGHEREQPGGDAIARTAIHDLKRHVSNLAVSEVVLALEERRNALPLKDLLRIKTAGFTSTISPASWSARRGGRSRYGQPLVVHLFDGFLGPGLSSAAKRLFDIVVSLVLLALMAPVIGLFALLVKLDSKGPAFFRQSAWACSGRALM
jgi:hypothetical protein